MKRCLRRGRRRRRGRRPRHGAAFVAEQRGCCREGFGSGRPVRFAVTGPLGAERRQHDPLKGGVLLGAAHDRPRARRREPVLGQQPAGGRVDADGRRAQPVPQDQGRVGEAGWDGVAVPPERDRRVRGDDTGHRDLSRGTRWRASRGAVRCRRARRRSCACRWRCGARGRRRGRRGSGPVTPALPRAWSRSWSATTVRT